MRVKLEEVCEIQYGFAFDSELFTDNAIYPPLVRIRDVKRGFSETYYSGPFSEDYVLHFGDLLVGMDGEFNIARWKSTDALLNQRVCKLKAKKGINEEYLRFIMSKALKEIEERTAFVTVKHLSAKELSKVELDIPILKEQEKIAESLASIESIIALRQQQHTKLDELVKARFVELFGDPERNPMGWPIVRITEVLGGKVSNGFFAKRDAYCENGNVQILGVSNIVNRMYSNIVNLPRTNASKKDEQKYGVKYGDLLFCRSSLVAEGIGKASIVPKGTQQNVLFECHVIRLPLDTQKCVPEFMQALSATKFFRHQILAQSKTSTMTTIGQDGILKSHIILPPIEQQRKFLHFVEQVDKAKFDNPAEFG